MTRRPTTPSGVVSTLALLVALPLMAGCAAPLAVVATGAAAAEGTSLTSTKKSLADHVVSGLTGQDCSVVSFTETGNYCPEKVVVDRSNLYCYRTLADVECHHIPDPYRNGDRALASPPPVRKPANQRTAFD